MGDVERRRRPEPGPRLDLTVTGAEPDAIVERGGDMDNPGDSVGGRTVVGIAADEERRSLAQVGAHEHVVTREPAGIGRGAGELGDHRDPGSDGEHPDRRRAVRRADVELLAERLDQTRRDRQRVVDRRLRTVDFGQDDVADPCRREQRAGAQGRAVGDPIERIDHDVVGVGRRRRPPVGEVERTVVDHCEGDPVAVLPTRNGQHPRIAEVQHAVVALGRIEWELGTEQRSGAESAARPTRRR